MKRFKTEKGINFEAFSPPKKINFKEFNLENGLHCILYKDNNNPIVAVTLGYKVGSKDEESDKKGIAHLFEHMMFQGSAHLDKNGHFLEVMRSGGVCNAFTMQDVTVYYEIMPSHNLEMSLWLESERMSSLNVSEENLTNQKNVVIEEKKQVYDNAPYGSTLENIFNNVFKGSNYEITVIGETKDIESFTVDEAKDFHDNYYSPENAVLVVAGDIEYDNAELLIRKYFSDIDKKNNKERKKNDVPVMKEDREIVIHDNVQLPVLNICFQIPKSGRKENYALEFFCEILANNKSSRLYKKLVYEEKSVRSIRAFMYVLEDGGVFIIKAMINPGIDPEKIKNEIFDSIRDMVDNGITDEEFMKIKNQIEFENTIKFLKLHNITVETVFNYFYFGDTGRINSEVDKYLSVTKDSVIEAVKEFILQNKKLTLIYLPKK